MDEYYTSMSEDEKLQEALWQLLAQLNRRSILSHHL